MVRSETEVPGSLGINLWASTSHPPVEALCHRFPIVVPPLGIIRHTHVSVRRRELVGQFWVYLGDRLFVYRCIGYELGEPLVVFPRYAVGDQLHRLILVGGSFRNYKVVGGLQVLVPVDLDRSSGVDLLLYPPVPTRHERHLTTGDLLLRLGTAFPPHYLISNGIEFV